LLKSESFLLLAGMKPGPFSDSPHEKKQVYKGAFSEGTYIKKSPRAKDFFKT